MSLFRPFYPQIGEIGWAGLDSTSRPNKVTFMLICKNDKMGVPTILGKYGVNWYH